MPWFDQAPWLVALAPFFGLFLSAFAKRTDPFIAGDRVYRHDAPARLSHWTHGIGTAVCDRDRIIATAGIPKKDLLDKPVSKQLDELMRRKKAFVSSGEDTVLAAEGGLRTANAAFPISCAGDLCGMFLLIKDEDAKPGETQEHLRLGKLASDFLSRETVE